MVEYKKYLNEKDVRFMYPEFAYTRAMQFILAVISTISAFIFIYLIANLLLQLYGEKASAKQKGIFAFLIGVMLNQAWVYAIYFIGGMRSFSNLVYALVVTPNPVFALLYYLFGVKVLLLSPIRSIKLMGHVYLYYIIIKSFNRLLTSIFFVQPPGRYNYLLSAINQLILFIVFLVVYLVTKKILENYKYRIKLNLFLNFKKELVTYFLQATGIYLIMVVLPLFVSEEIAVNFIILLLFVLSFVLTILWDMYLSVRNESRNRSAHISILLKGTSTASIGDISELNRRMNENPSLISILINKCIYAEKLKVKMNMDLKSRLDNLYIDNVDACIIVACLLGNAIEAAAKSEQRIVSFAIEAMADAGKLIIINNSAATPVDTDKILFQSTVSKRRQHNKGLAAIRKIISKYGNCTLQLSYNNYTVSAYFQIKQEHLLQHLHANIVNNSL